MACPYALGSEPLFSVRRVAGCAFVADLEGAMFFGLDHMADLRLEHLLPGEKDTAAARGRLMAVVEIAVGFQPQKQAM